jgi:hypothetical protein
MKLWMVTAALLAATPALAVDAEVVKATAGRWLIAPEDGRKGCVVTLLAGQAIGGFAVEGAEACRSALPRFADAAAWNFGGDSDLYFIDPVRKKIADFKEEEDGTYAEVSGTKTRLLMLKAPAGVDHVPMAQEVFGTFDMVRPGGAKICSVTFKDTPPEGGEESFALTLGKTCDAAVTKLKLASWKIEGLKLMLFGTDGDSLGFIPGAKGFSKDPDEGGKPLDLVRRK